MPGSTDCRENNTLIWRRHHDANPTLQLVLSGKAKDAIRAASPSTPPGTALTEEAPPQASSDLRPPPPEFSPSDVALPSPTNYQPSGMDGTETIRKTSGQGREWCQYSFRVRRKAPGSQHFSGKALHSGPTRAPSASRASCAWTQSSSRSIAHSCLPVECGREAQEGEGSIRRRTAFPRRAERRPGITGATPLSMIASMVMLNMCTLEGVAPTGVQVEDRCRLRQGSFEKTRDPQSRARRGLPGRRAPIAHEGGFSVEACVRSWPFRGLSVCEKKATMLGLLAAFTYCPPPRQTHQHRRVPHRRQHEPQHHAGVSSTSTSSSTDWVLEAVVSAVGLDAAPTAGDASSWISGGSERELEAAPPPMTHGASDPLPFLDVSFSPFF